MDNDDLYSRFVTLLKNKPPFMKNNQSWASFQLFNLDFLLNFIKIVLFSNQCFIL
jgi:hypothetical protein